MCRTKQRRTFLLAPAIIALITLAVTACSGGRDSALERAEETSEAPPSIDEVLTKSYGETWKPWRGDLDGMIERRIIRVVAPYGGYMYYFDNGEPRGAAWELAKRLEDFLNEDLGRRNLRVLVVLIPLSRDQLIPALLDGHADLIAADLTMTAMRNTEVAFSRPLLKDIDEVVVAGRNVNDIETLDDIGGREIHVRRSSSYFEHLVRLSESMRERGVEPPDIITVDELLESEDILDMANAGMIEMTVLDDYKAEFWAKVFPDIEVRKDLVVHEGGSIAWAVRKDSTALLGKLNEFLRQYGRGTLVGNDTYNRYLDDAIELRCSRSLTADERLNKLADTFMRFADQYELDWLKLAAQGFQESKLRQNRRSDAGAIGIMQIKSSTAMDPNVGIDDITTVEGNIHAGTKYMRFLMDRYFSDEDISELDRWLLALAAYNAGPSRVIELRREARKSGYDANVWFNNVEIIAARRIGRETVLYVSNIFKYYTGYRMASAKISESRERYGLTLGSCTDR